jgi:hypothetical protein
MRRVIVLIGILVVVLVVAWVWADRTSRGPSGGAQQPSPHAIDQSG